MGAGMSPRALARCRRLVITDISDRDNPFRKKFEVFDPRQKDMCIFNISVRTPQDERRLRQGLMGKYRIPSQNVSLVEKEEEVGEDWT